MALARLARRGKLHVLAVAKAPANLLWYSICSLRSPSAADARRHARTARRRIDLVGGG